MRFIHVLRGSACAVLVSLAPACSAILGIDDVSSRTPDASSPGPVDCHIKSDFPRISSSDTMTELSRFVDGNETGPELDFSFDADGSGVLDTLVVRLYDNTPPHTIVTAPGTYDLLASDASFQICAICVSIDLEFDTRTGTGSETFLALGQGTLTLTAADTTGLVGSLHNLRFRHVDRSGTNVDDGCFATIEDVEFNAKYSPPLAEPGPT